jgi:deazaflavin-dependent oxidoreductase (nitroreductase family)
MMADVDRWKKMNDPVIEAFRANDGEVAGRQWPVLLLTTIGAKSGQPRVNPLNYSVDGDRLVVIASKGGSPTSPDWYHNLVANPRVIVEVGTERFPATARVTSGEERERLYAAQAQLMPGFAAYQEQTSRSIPVVVLERLLD